MAIDRELSNNAWHEAGHCVAAFCTNVPVDLVTIVASAGAAGRCNLGAGGSARDKAIAIAAGPIADDLYNIDQRNGVRTPRFRSDKEYIEALLSPIIPRLTGACDRGDFMFDPEVVKVFDKAKRIVHDNWVAICQVASQLLRSKTISGAGLQTLLANTITRKETESDAFMRNSEKRLARIRRDRANLTSKYGKRQKLVFPMRGGLSAVIGHGFMSDLMARHGIQTMSYSERQAIVDEHRRLVARPSYRAAACLNKPATGMTARSVKNRDAARRAWLSSQD